MNPNHSQVRTQEFAERLAEVVRSEMPLADGLRSAADQASSRRLARPLRRLAGLAESGMGWDELLVENETGLPQHVLGILVAGIRSGNLGDALDNLIDQQRARSDQRRQLFWSLAYPATLIVLSSLLFLATMFLVVRPMEALYADFGIELPLLTTFWIELSHVLPNVLVVLVGGGVVAYVGIRFVGGRTLWSRFVAAIPILGPMVHWGGTAEMLRLLKIFASHQSPLPEALRLSAHGIANANVAVVADWLADGVEAGIPLAELMDSTPRVPPAIVPIVRWGEANASLSESFQTAYELLEGHLRLRNSMLSVLAAPLVFTGIGIALALMVVGLIMPFVSMLGALT